MLRRLQDLACVDASGEDTASPLALPRAARPTQPLTTLGCQWRARLFLASYQPQPVLWPQLEHV